MDQNAKNNVGTHSCFHISELKTVYMHLSYGCAFRMGSNNLLGKGDIYRERKRREREWE
jgi:hypothetical protein